jgi:hypothetical protein
VRGFGAAQPGLRASRGRGAVSTTRPAATSASPAQPTTGRRSPTTITARTVATAGSSSDSVVAVLAGMCASAQPNSRYPVNIGTRAMYPPAAAFDADATSGPPVTSSTGRSRSPPSPKTAPIAARAGPPRPMSRCAAQV